MRWKKQMGLFLIYILLLTLAGCKRQTEWSEDFFAMDTYMNVTCFGGKEEDIELAKEQILSLEKKLSVTNADSEVSKINQSGGKTVEVSGDVEELLQAALELSVRSDGAFDISMYPVLKLWGFTTGEYQVPQETLLKQVLAQTGYEKISLENDSFTMPDGMEIDFGAVAKGYAGKLAAEKLKEAGVKSAILNLGGNIQTIGRKPDGSKWKVAIKDPVNTQNYAGVLEIGEKAVVTSGGYERYFTDENGTVWWHILNPKTGYPAKSGLISVTVVGDDGMLCDGLSTMLFVMGREAAEEYWRTYGGFEAVFLTDEGKIFITEGLKDCFTAAGDYKEQGVTVIK